MAILKFLSCAKTKEEAEWDSKIKRPRCLPLFNNPRKLIYGFQVIIIVGVLHAILVGYIGGTYGAFDRFQIIGYVSSFAAALILTPLAVYGIVSLRNWVIQKQTFIVFNILAFLSLILGILAIIPFLLSLNLEESGKYMRAYFKDNEDLPRIWVTIHKENKCCGLKLWKDFLTDGEKANQSEFRLPKSCCNSKLCQKDSRVLTTLTLDTAPQLVYNKGCYIKNQHLVTGSSAEHIFNAFLIALCIFPLYPIFIISVFIYYWVRIKIFHDVDPAYIHSLDERTTTETEETQSIKDFFGVYAPSNLRKVTLDKYPVPWEKENNENHQLQSLPELHILRIKPSDENMTVSKITSIKSRRGIERRDPPPGGPFGPSQRESKAIALKRRIWKQMSKFRVRKNEYTKEDLGKGLISVSQISISPSDMITTRRRTEDHRESMNVVLPESLYSSRGSFESVTEIDPNESIPSSSRQGNSSNGELNNEGLRIKKNLPVVVETAPVKRHEVHLPDKFWQLD